MEANQPRPTAEDHPFPIHALDPVLEAYLTEASKSLMCDSSMIGVAMLVVLATCIGPAYNIRVRHDWTEPAILYAMLIAPSGGAKTPVMKRVVGDLRASQATRTRVLTDVTPSGLLDTLAEFEGGALVYWDELSKALKGPKSSMLNEMLELYSGDEIKRQRSSTSDRNLHLLHPRANVLTGIQPKVLKRIARKEAIESGFLARFMMVHRGLSFRAWNPEGMTKDTASAFRQVLGQLMEWQSQSVTPHELPLSPDALSMFGVHFEGVEREKMAFGDSIATEILAKQPGLAARIALVLELSRAASRGIPPAEVSQGSMDAAIEIAQWVIPEQLRVFDDLDLGSQESETTSPLAHARQVLAGMPSEFKTADFEGAVSMRGLSDRTARTWLKALLQEDLVRTTGGGHYQKSLDHPTS